MSRFKKGQLVAVERRGQLMRYVKVQSVNENKNTVSLHNDPLSRFDATTGEQVGLTGKAVPSIRPLTPKELQNLQEV